MTQAQRLAKQCLKNAKDLLGAGWRHVGPDIKVALVRNYAWHIITCQDEAIPAQAIRDLVMDLDKALEELFDETVL